MVLDEKPNRTIRSPHSSSGAVEAVSVGLRREGSRLDPPSTGPVTFSETLSG
jgi:hypothetical protein